MARVLLLTMAEGPHGFNKLLVVKELKDDLAHDPEFLSMFLDEARIAARLEPPEHRADLRGRQRGVSVLPGDGVPGGAAAERALPQE